MSRLLVAAAALTAALSPAAAADLPRLLPPAPPVQWNWTGLYWGAHLGGSYGQSSFTSPFGPSLYGDHVRTPSVLAGVQLGYNYQVSPNWLLGVEADVSALNGDGTQTCFAPDGFFLSANCRVKHNAMATGTGRLGFVTGRGGRTLLYGKAGVAWLAQSIDIATNPLGLQTSSNDGRFGWTVGAGVEQALAPAWSVKLEYGYADFGSKTMATPNSFAQLFYPFFYVPVPGSTTSVSQTSHTVKVGLNMKFGGDAYARFDDYALRGGLRDEPVIADAEIGARVWYSFGRFQKDLGAGVTEGRQNVLVSRLTYDTTAASGELFGRLNAPSDLFIKGFAGGGTLTKGAMNDEDWLIARQTVPYSNTLSDPVKGSIAYATFDAGYDLIRGRDARFGGFVGYNYYRDNKSAYGCVQFANPNAGCIPSFPTSTLGITENNTWHSLRLGVNGTIGLGHGLTLTGDAAYLPYVKFFGEDNHLQRRDVSNTVSPERGTGQGVQLEAILSYQFNNAFSVGAGARYWAMWATKDAYTNAFGSDCPCQTLPVRTERYGTFLQAAYKFDSLK